MLLAVDIGNTNITFGLFKGKELIGQYRLVSNVAKSHESYAIDIIEVLVNDDIDCLAIQNIIIASVVPKLTNTIKLALQKFYAGPIITVGDDGFNIDIEIKLENKKEVGIDRLVNSFFAAQKFGCDLIVVDLGTATTFDVIGGNGEYLGGVIAPGVNLSIKALYEMTAKLPMIKLQKQKNVIGKSTVEAMNSGIYFGYASLIEGLLARIKQEYGKEMQVIMTGGLSALFIDVIKDVNYVEPNLTLEGLKLLFESYCK